MYLIQPIHFLKLSHINTVLFNQKHLFILLKLFWDEIGKKNNLLLIGGRMLRNHGAYSTTKMLTWWENSSRENNTNLKVTRSETIQYRVPKALLENFRNSIYLDGGNPLLNKPWPNCAYGLRNQNFGNLNKKTQQEKSQSWNSDSYNGKLQTGDSRTVIIKIQRGYFVIN